MILIVVDTLRADRMSLYGHTRPTTPTLDALAAEGVTFDRAISQAPWTQPAMASLFSSTYPSVHRVLDYKTAVHTLLDADVPRVATFDERFVTLAEALRQAGYSTAAFVTNPFLLPEYGFSQGFDYYDTPFRKRDISGRQLNATLRTWLQDHPPNTPLFLYLHYMDVHGPYRAPSDILNSFLSEVESAPTRRALTPDEVQRLGALATPPQDPTARPRHLALSPYHEYWLARYDAAVRHLDAQIAGLAATLREAGLWEAAYVVITADHGESLCEHGVWEHGYTLNDTELRVPLILRWPGILPAGRRVHSTVRLIDLMPTLLEQLDIPIPDDVQGTSVVARLEDHVAAPPALAEGVKLQPEAQAVYDGTWKLVLSSRAELYNLAVDPYEHTDLSLAQPERVATLRAFAGRQNHANRARAEARAPVPAAPVSAEQLERLRSLGYVR